jgi:DNA-binding PadR family transcriptional regulator
MRHRERRSSSVLRCSHDLNTIYRDCVKQYVSSASSRQALALARMNDAPRSQFGLHGRGGHIRRGDVRNLLLAALLSGSAHGYELMRRLEEESDGRWRPSPGSVYPSLQLLEEQGLVKSREGGGRKIYDLTPHGRQQADGELLQGLARGNGPSAHHLAVREAVDQLHMATKQVVISGSPAQLEQAVEIIQSARRAIYQLLATE